MTDADDMAKMMHGGSDHDDLVAVRDKARGKEQPIEVQFEEEEGGGRFEDNDAAISHFAINKELTESFNEHQMMLLTGDIPVDKTRTIPVGGGNVAAYLPIEFYIDALNKITGWGWELEIDEWYGDDKGDEVNCSGKMVIHGVARTFRIHCHGGARRDGNRNLTMADLRKTAQSDMTKNGARNLGIGLRLREPVFLEQVKVHHGVAKEPPKREINELEGLLKEMNLDADAVGIEPWEWKSDERVLHWQKELRSRK